MNNHEPENDNTSIFDGDALDDLIGLTKVTMDRIMSSGCECRSDVWGLYVFYCYTAKWQKSKVIKCTNEYAMKGSDLGIVRFQRAKATLRKLNLISERRRRCEDTNRITGVYVQVHYATRSKPDDSGVHPPCLPYARENPCGGGRGNKCLERNNKEMLSRELGEMLSPKIISGGDYWDEPDTFELAAEELGKEKQAKETKPKKAIVKFTAPLDSEFKRAIRQQFAGYKIDYQLQEAKMDAWILLNPPRKKSRKFYANWIARAAEQAPKERSM